MTQKRYNEIPKRQKCVNKEEPYIGGAIDIFDDNLEKPQSQVNQERIEDIAAETRRAQQAESTIDGKIAAEKTRAEGVEQGLNTRLETVEQLAEISISGDEAQIATGSDFDNPDAPKREKIPTVGAILDGADNEPVIDSEKLVTSKGTFNAIEFGVNQTVKIINNEYVRDNGDFAHYSYWSRTDYLYIRGLDKLHYNNGGPQSSYCAFYDVNKQFISIFAINEGEYDVVVPDNVVWCALSNTTAGMEQLTITNLPKFNGIVDIDAEIAYIQQKINTVDNEPTPNSENFVKSGGVTKVYGEYIEGENIPLLKYKDKDKKELFEFGTNGKPIFPKNDTFDVVDTTNSSNIYNIKDKKGTYIEKLHNNGTREHKNNLDTFNKVSVKELHIRSSKGLSKLGNQLNMLTDIFTFNPYYECLQYVLQLKRPHSEYPQLDQEGLLLCWFSDLHGADDNFSRIIQFKNAFPKYIDDTILTGDIVMAQYPDNISFIEKYNANDTLLVIGNHDVWRRNQTPVENMPELDVYNKFFKPYIANWNVTQPSNADTGKCYYYKDYNSKNIRLIVVNCMHDTEDQRTWFTETLATAKERGLHVICSSHYPVDSSVITADENKLLTDNTFQAYDARYNIFETSSMSRFCASEVDNFIADGGSFVCWICGHMHSDYFGLCIHHHNQVMIGVENAGHHKDGNDSDRITGTKTQDSFNLISFDVSKKFIRIVRIGNDFDRLLRHKKAITYNYNENKIITNY